MTIPISLNTISNLQDTTTAQTNINANSAAITGGFSTALNVIGDQMKGNLDMNSNQILNLPAPATANSPVRLTDVTSSSSIASVPPVGTSGAVVPLLNAANVWSNTQSFGALTATTITASTISATTVNGSVSASSLVVSGTSVFTGSVSLPLSAARTRSLSTLNLYVNQATGSNSNTGASATSAFSTINYAVNYFYANYDLAAESVNINVAPGTYNETVTIESLDRGAAADVAIIGTGGSATTIVNAPSGSCFAIKDFGVLDIQGFTLTGSSSAVAAISCGQFGICDFTSDMVFGAFPLVGAAHFTVSQNASINILNNYTISGAVSYHYLAQTGGLLATNTITVTMPTTLAFTTFGYFYQGARGSLGGLTFTGSGATSCTGTRFFIGDNGWVGGGGLDLNATLPGNASGVYYSSLPYDYLTAANTVTSLSNISARKGLLAVVSDATATAANATVTGGSTNTVLTWYNGSSWRILGS